MLTTLRGFGVRNVAYINGRDFDQQAATWPDFADAACEAYIGEQSNCTLTPDPNISCRGRQIGGTDPPNCKSNLTCQNAAALDPGAAIVTTPRRELWGDFTAVMNPGNTKWQSLVVNQSLELFKWGMDGVYPSSRFGPPKSFSGPECILSRMDIHHENYSWDLEINLGDRFAHAGVYIDQASSFPPQPCFNQRGRGVGASWVEGNRAVFASIRERVALALDVKDILIPLCIFH